jgi:hypothetical protein
MRWSWSPDGRRYNDFMPLLIGSGMLFVSLPSFVMLLVFPDQGSGAFALFLLFVLGIGNLAGACLVVLGVRICSYPGSLAYRITHGHILRW